MNPNPYLRDENPAQPGPISQLDPASLTPIPTPRQLRITIRTLMSLVLASGVLLAGIVGGARNSSPAVILFLIVLCLIVATVASIPIAIQTHRARQDALLRALAIAAEQEMPLAPALYAIADQGGVFFRNRAVAMAQALSSGATFPEALDRVPGVLPRDAEVMARVGWESGVLAGSLREASTARSTRRRLWTGFFIRIAYILGLLVFLQLIVGFVMYFIIPKFEAIFADFGLPLPEITKIVIRISHWVVQFGVFTGALFVLEVVTLLVLPFAAGGVLFGGVPLIDRLFLRRHTAVILRALARVVEGEKPLPAAFATLARRYPIAWVRDRLRRVALDVDRGVDWCEALAAHRLINETDAALLDSARRVGNLPWALRETAENGERRLAFKLQALSQALFPLLVMGMGFMVFIMAVAYFTPLISLIQRLAG